MITCLHGFLGRPSDWDFLGDAGFGIKALDLFHGETIPRNGDAVLGYSMGGRLALGALAEGADYQRAVIVSAGLNLRDECERLERRKRDERWAAQFESDSWSAVMSDWNAQAVFGGHALPRAEGDFDRRALAAALRAWSSGELPPLDADLSRMQIPILWIAGERDERYASEARRAAELTPCGELALCPGAGHRVPWENTGWFVDRLREFLSRTTEPMG